MTEITLVEKVPEPHARDTHANSAGIVRQFLQNRGYDVVVDGNRLHCSKVEKFDKYTLCDILLVALVEALPEVDRVVARLEVDYQHFYREILAGRRIKERLQIKKHPFIKLRKPYICTSYEYEGVPVTFQITPLILIQRENIWETRVGTTTPVDLLSLDTASLDFYVQQHQNQLSETAASKLDFAKFYYWKGANWALEYGHYPLMLLWFVKLITAILQVPFPLDLGGMIALTAVSYGGIILANMLLFQLFRRSQVNELRRMKGGVSRGASSAYGHSMEVVPVQEELNNPTVTTLPEVVEVPRSRGPSRNNTLEEIHHGIVLLLNLKDTRVLVAHAKELLVCTFRWVIAQSGEPTAETHLVSLLKQVKGDPRLVEMGAELKLWVRKLLTNTPFTADEMKAMKKFYLLLLNALNLLPESLRLVVRDATGQRRQAGHQGVEELPGAEPNFLEGVQGTNSQDLSDFERPAARPPVIQLPKSDQPTPNLNVESIPRNLHPDVPEAPIPYLEKMWDEDVTGTTCTILVDGDNSAHYEQLGQFSECLKNLDVRKVCIDRRKLHNQKVSAKFAGVDLPAVLVKRGTYEELVPFQEPGDEVRLHHILDALLHPKSEIRLKEKPSAGSTALDLKADSQIEAIQQQYNEAEQSLVSTMTEFKRQEVEKVQFFTKMFPKGCIMIDGSNMAYLQKDHNLAGATGARMESIAIVVDMLRAMGFVQDLITVYFDTNFRHKLDPPDAAQYLRLKAEQPSMYIEVQGGAKADNILVNAGKRLGKYIIITNDRLTDQKPEVRRHRVSVTLAVIGGQSLPCLSTATVEELLDAFYGRLELPPERKE